MLSLRRTMTFHYDKNKDKVYNPLELRFFILFKKFQCEKTNIHYHGWSLARFINPHITECNNFTENHQDRRQVPPTTPNLLHYFSNKR